MRKRRPFYPADGFPPEPRKGPVLKGRLALWADQSAGYANGTEGRNRDNGCSGEAVRDMSAGWLRKSFWLKPAGRQTRLTTGQGLVACGGFYSVIRAGSNRPGDV